MIEEYHFGSITVDGKVYNYDVEVHWTGEVLSWRRGESHIIDVEDVKRVATKSIDTIIIGTGAYGVARVTEECQNLIQEKGIKLIIDETGEAIKTFNVILEESKNEEGKQEKVMGLFHLTC